MSGRSFVGGFIRRQALSQEISKPLKMLRRFHKVEKAMMSDIQRKDPFPYGDALCVPLEEVIEFRQTKRNWMIVESNRGKIRVKAFLTGR